MRQAFRFPTILAFPQLSYVKASRIPSGSDIEDGQHSQERRSLTGTSPLQHPSSAKAGHSPVLPPYANRFTSSEALCPPKPKLLLKAMSTFASRATCGT